MNFIKKYLKYLYHLKIKFPKNIVLDRCAASVKLNQLDTLKNIDIKILNYNLHEFEKWVLKYFPQYKKSFGELENKKLIEFFTTFKLLDIQKNDVYIDIAGGQYSYINKVDCKKKYLQDYRITDKIKDEIGNNVLYLEGNANKIDLKSASVTKMSVHHSFEHFKENADILFIREIQRLLGPGGRCCIIPIFILDKYIELTDKFTFKNKFDFKSTQIIDPSATLAGGDSCGNYARIYDLKSFQRRVLDQIDHHLISLKLYEITMNEKTIPDMKIKSHKRVSKINVPYRVLFIEKKK